MIDSTIFAGTLSMVQPKPADSVLERAAIPHPSHLVELLPCAALLYAGDDRILDANRMFCELLGHAPDELACRCVADLTPAEDRRRDEMMHARLLDGRDTELSYKKRFIDGSGAGVWCEVELKCIEDGDPVQYLALVRKLDAHAPDAAVTDDRTIADAMPQIVWSTLPDGFHDYFNRRWYEYTGMTEKEAQGDAWTGLLHPDDRPRMQARWEHSLATGEPYETEFRLRHRSGNYHWQLGRALPVRNEQGRIVRWMGTSTDIHDRILMQDALQDAQARLEAALAAADIGTWTWDIPPDRMHADRNLAAMFGIAPEHADDQSVAAYFGALHPDDVEAVRTAIEKARVSGAPYDAQFRTRAADGTIRYMQARGTVVSDADGKPLTMSGAVLDVTRQQVAEQALRSSELTFRTLADNIPQLAWMADSDGYIFWYNNRWFEYTGSTLEQMQGWGWTRVHHPDHVERVLAHYRKQIVEDQTVWEDTFPLRGADGRYRWFLSRAVPIRDQHGRVLRWLGTNTDVTLQREAEQALQLESRRKDNFLAMLAHELRNPLAPISTAAQLLKMGARNPENIQRSSDIIDRQVKHMSDLVNDVMDVSRVTRGLVSISQEEVGVDWVVDAAVEQSRPLIEARGQTLVLELHSGAASVLGDRTRLVQVLANLLNNAAKYTQAGGRITLGTAVRGGRVEISVADNGIGIDAALLPHVFELFTQAERTPERGEGGLGLGLALVKSIVELHDGRVSAVSAGRGMGSAFTVSLPILLSLLPPDDAGAPRPQAALRRILPST